MTDSRPMNPAAAYRTDAPRSAIESHDIAALLRTHPRAIEKAVTNA